MKEIFICHHRDMYEIEEVSSAVNETDNEQSETSTNLENDKDDQCFRQN